jgi:Sec-independent protein translocase protein TatA
MGFGTEILIVLLLGFLILGPKQMHAMLGHVARAKAELENAKGGIRSLLSAGLDAAPRNVENRSIESLQDE